MSACDATWEVDLICRYFHETSDPGRPTGDWFKQMDPGGTLDDRKHVFDLLTGDAANSNPDLGQLRGSMIPWNQRNAGIIKAFKSELACGSVVKLTFRKYMGWGSAEPPRRGLNYKGWNGVLWVVKSLKAGRPVRAYLKKKDHYVGIVGFRGMSVHHEAPAGDAYRNYEFLIIDPWAGGAETGSTTITYAGAVTKFLGIAKQVGPKIMYDTYEITDVEGYQPF